MTTVQVELNLETFTHFFVIEQSLTHHTTILLQVDELNALIPRTRINAKFA